MSQKNNNNKQTLSPEFGKPVYDYIASQEVKVNTGERQTKVRKIVI